MIDFLQGQKKFKSLHFIHITHILDKVKAVVKYCKIILQYSSNHFPIFKKNILYYIQ